MHLEFVFALSLLAKGALCGAVLNHTTLPGTWSNLANITLNNGTQYPRQEASVARIGDDIYLLGGVAPFNGVTFPTINAVQKYSVTSNNWTQVASMPVALNHVNVAAVYGQIYVLGGLAPTASGGELYWNASGACSVYNPSTDKWTILPDMPQGRAIGSAATMVINDTIYLPGGIINTNLTNDEEGTTAMFTSYNTAAKSWTVLPNLPAPRDHAGKGVYGTMLYILGGRLNGHWNVVNTVFGFDTQTNNWSTDFAVMPIRRGGAASATIGSLTFVAGGEGDPNTTYNVWPQMQAYNARTNTWKSYKDMAIPVHGTAAAAVNGKVIVPGGSPKIGGDPTAVVQEFVP